MMIAMATAASAAAIAMMNMVKNKPSSFPGQRYLLKKTKFRSRLYSNSYTDIYLS